MSSRYVRRWLLAIREDEKLSAHAKLVAFVLGTYMNAAGVCWPGQSTLASACGYEERTSVWRGVSELRQAGYLAQR